MNLSTLLLLSATISQPQVVAKEEFNIESYRVLEHGICILLKGEIIHPNHYKKYEHVAKNIIRQIEQNGIMLKDNKLTPYIHDGKLEILCTVYSYMKQELEPHL